jgi:Peptidase_G2, IMC autoproteolytic cleavage domain
MAYTIYKSNGTFLTTVPDGQINTTSTSVGLPGRNYVGYGQAVDTNFVHMLENFADTLPPSNPLQGQLWFDTNTNTLRVCPADGTAIASQWYTLASDAANANSTTTFSFINVTGNITGNNASFTGVLSTSSLTAIDISASGNITATSLTTGNNTTSGTITGNWTLTSGSRLQATYADIAERFEAETMLEPGTVVELGGSKEIRAVRYELSEDVFGVVSNTAAYLMNAQAGSDSTHPPIAVSGRVPVKVTGKINKGQRLVSAGNGYARAANEGEATAFNTIGRALEDKTSIDIGIIEAIVIIR